MRVRVLFFGMLKDLAAKSAEDVEVREGTSVGEMLELCAARLPGLRDYLSSAAVAVNAQYVGSDTKLNPNDEVAILPPVSGGAFDGPLVRLVRERIVAQDIVPGMESPEDGAVVIFDGIVRNHSRKRKTLYLDYEAYEAMALKKLQELAEQSLRQFAIRNVALVHRLGRLQIGESSVLIAVFSAHRAPAFEACRWLIDTLKKTVPIWKKEYFEDGAVWADGEAFPDEIPRAKL